MKELTSTDNIGMERAIPIGSLTRDQRREYERSKEMLMKAEVSGVMLQDVANAQDKIIADNKSRGDDLVISNMMFDQTRKVHYFEVTGHFDNGAFDVMAPDSISIMYSQMESTEDGIDIDGLAKVGTGEVDPDSYKEDIELKSFQKRFVKTVGHSQPPAEDDVKRESEDLADALARNSHHKKSEVKEYLEAFVNVMMDDTKGKGYFKRILGAIFSRG